MSKMYLIGNSHLDPVWMWRWQEGYTEVLQTFRSALDRMKEFDDIKFTSACSIYYEWIEKTDPEMFREIRERIKEGRWAIAGGWLLQPDCNIPCGESFARQALFGQRYFKEKFGITAKTGYNVDSFGHNAGLPKILKASGMDNYVFMRPSPLEDTKKDSLFNWASDDGSSVCAFRIPVCYNLELKNFENFEKIRETEEKEGIDYMLFFGVGNHGGGPTIELINEINKVKPEDAVYATPDEYFENAKRKNLKTYTGDLQHHARGCYTAETSVKSGNRRCESSLLAAERFSVMAKEILGVKYPKEELKRAWKNLLFNQFHDILGGCAIKSAYKDADYLFGETMSICEKIINDATQKIAWSIDTVGSVELPAYKNKRMRIWEHEKLGTPVVVFNSHPWEVTENVRVYTYSAVTYMTDDKGTVIPHQAVRGEQTNSDDRSITEFTATIPAMGYRVYRFFLEKETDVTFAKKLFITEHSIENSKIIVEFDEKTGDICRFYDKEQKKNIIDAPSSAVVLDETDSDTWAHDKAVLGKEIGRFGTPEFKILEDGNVSATLRVTTRYNACVMVRDYTVIPDSDRVTVKACVDFNEKHRTLKLAFKTKADVTAQSAYTAVTKKQSLGEEPCGWWISAGGLGIANDSKYGYDTTGNEVRMSVLRTAIYCDHFGERDELCEYMDMKRHEFSYLLFPFKSNAQAEKVAHELNFSARVVMGSFKKGKLKESFSGIETDNKNVMITAIKECEDGFENLVRAYETKGDNGELNINLFGKKISMDFGAFALKTVTESGKELNLTEITEGAEK